MSTITYQVQQCTGYQYEPIPEGDFETAEEALASMRALESNLGWRNLRVVELESQDSTVSAAGVDSECFENDFEEPLALIVEALENSRPRADHYPEARERHEAALRAARALLSI